MRSKVSEATVQRLFIYLRTLEKFQKNLTLSSQKFSKLVGINECSIRRDLACFGKFGIPGCGYKVEELRREIIHILGLNREWKLALVGVGRLGRALLVYPGFNREKFRIRLAFDNDPQKIGKILEGILVQDVEKVPYLLPKFRIKIGIIATPTEAAQRVADKLIEGRVRGILNFTSKHLVVPDNIKVKNVDLSTSVEMLSFFLTHRINES